MIASHFKMSQTPALAYHDGFLRHGHIIIIFSKGNFALKYLVYSKAMYF